LQEFALFRGEAIASPLFPFVHPDRAKDDPKVIVIDPDISFGRPVIVGTRIPTSILAERYQAGESVELLRNEDQITSKLLGQAACLPWDSRDGYPNLFNSHS